MFEQNTVRTNDCNAMTTLFNGVAVFISIDIIIEIES